MQSGTRLILHGFQTLLALPSRTLGGGGFVNQFGRGCPREARAAPPDGLKTSYALMKTTELKMLWKVVMAGEDRPLAAADLCLLMRIRLALMDYEGQIKEG